jgi:hypothetical protein
MDVILKSFVETQKSSGIKWNVKLQGKGYDIVFKPEVCMVLGDNEGQAKMCAQYQSRSSTGVKSLCRHCKVPTDKIHCTYEEVYPLHNRQQINKWIETFLSGNKPIRTAMKMLLQECSHQAVRNAWRDVSFGWYGLGNINAATPAHILHTILMGVLEKLEEAILTCRKPNADAIISEIRNTRKKAFAARQAKLNSRVQKMIATRTKKYKEKMKHENKRIRMDLECRLKEMNEDLKNSTHDTLVTEAFTDDEMSKYLVFSKKVKNYVEVMAKNWGWLLLHQSDRSIGRTHFVSRITGSSKVQAHKMTGKMILYLLIFCSEFSTQYFESIERPDDNDNEYESTCNTKKRNTALHKGGYRELLNSNRVADYIWAIEEVLLTTEYIKHDLTLAELEQFQEYTPQSMYRLKSV